MGRADSWDSLVNHLRALIKTAPRGTQARIARHTGLDPSVVSDFANNKSGLAPENVFMVARFLGYELTMLPTVDLPSHTGGGKKPPHVNRKGGGDGAASLPESDPRAVHRENVLLKSTLRAVRAELVEGQQLAVRLVTLVDGALGDPEGPSPRARESRNDAARREGAR